MAIKTWAELADDELVAHAEVADAVDNGDLLWSENEPILADGYCYTRDDFETYLLHSDMSASGIESGECMSKSEMETYRVLAPAVTASSADSEWVVEDSTWRGRAVFSVNTATQSVLVEHSLNGGSYTSDGTINVTPGSGGNSTGWVNADAGFTMSIRITPYAGQNGTGDAGTPDVVNVPEPT